MYEEQYVALLTGGITFRKYIQCIVIGGKGSLPSASVRVEPILASDIEHLLAIKPCRPRTQVQPVIKEGSLCTHSLRGEMTETT
jgi:hypothetical protein